MTEETTVVHVTHGSYAGQRLALSKHDADAAISDGWAVDPFKPVDPDKEPKQLTDEERAHVLEKAEQGIAKLRGEEKDKDKDKDKDHDRKSMKPEHEAGYETREAKPAAPSRK